MAFEIRNVSPTLWPSPLNPAAMDGIRVDNLTPVVRGLIEQREAGYLLANRAVVNPDSEPLVGICGASGPSVVSVLLATGARHVICLDRLSVNISQLLRHRDRALSTDDQDKWPGEGAAKTMAFRRYNVGWGEFDFRKYREALIICELKMMGVDLHALAIRRNSYGNTEMSFRWPDHVNGPERKFTYVQSDLRDPHDYKREILDELERGIDFYFEKSSQGCLDSAHIYLPFINSSIRKFVLMGTNITSMNSMEGQVGEFLGGDFEMVDKVNPKYEQFFHHSLKIMSDLNPYWWRMFCWRRTH